MTIELYVVPPSPRGFKAMVLANHLGIDHVIRVIGNGDNRTPEYAALNPNMKVPTLKDGDYVLWESNAILHYLAAKRPESGLLPKDERARLDVLRWQFWDLAHWDPACAALLFEYVVKPHVLHAGEPDPAVIENAQAPFHRVASILNAQLKGKRFVAGDALTLADFSIGAALNYAKLAHFPIEPYGEIERWYGDLSALPAWRRTVMETMHAIEAEAA